MKRPPNRDLYSVLGVDPSASQDELREAYLSRTRVIHPDRFDPKSQPTEWRKANEMLAELNEAYSILRSASSRRQYDGTRGQSRAETHSAPPPPPPRREPPPTSSPPFELGELTPGQARFADLPKRVQERLLKRQRNKGEDQFQTSTASVLWNYIFVVILLCWFWYLFAATDGKKWGDDTLLWHGGFTLAAALLIGRNIVTIRRWGKSKLKSFFYVTPLYFITTEYDLVSFRPIWSLKDVSVTHNYKNGSYQNSDVVLKFDGHNEPLTLSSKAEVETAFGKMKAFDARLRTAFAEQQFDYFSTHDDFHGVSRTTVPKGTNLSPWSRVLIYATAVLLCGIAFAGAVSVNEDQAHRRWVQHPSPTRDYTSTRSRPSAPRRTVQPSYPAQAMPYSGAVRTYTYAERVAPFEIKAAQGSHYLVKLVESYTGSPVMSVFVRGGSTVNVDVPLGSYEVRYACGDTWYGYEYLFGPDTAYSKADKTFDFEVVGNQVRGFTVTLYKVANGNLRTSTIRPEQF